MGVNSLPKTVTRQRCDSDLNPGPTAPQSSTLTTRLPSHRNTLSTTVQTVLVWKCLHDAAPRYLADLCVPAASTDCRRQSLALHSPGPSWCPGLGRLLASAAFAAYGRRTWNRLPTAVRSPELSLASFKRQLKTHLSVPALDSAGCSCG